MDFEKIKLKNGIETLLVDAPGNTTASVQIWFRAGSALENNKNSGIAHFLEHMFFKGTKKRPGAMIAHDVESFGGEINAFTSFDYTCYYINAPLPHIKESIDILMDMVSAPSFLTKELIPERGVVFEEFRRSIDSASQFSFQRLQQSCFQKGYARSILGNEKTIKNFSREQLLDFRKQFYNRNTAFLVIAGDLSVANKKQRLINCIEKYKLPSGELPTFPKFQLKSQAQVEVHQKSVQMMQLTMCIQAPAIAAIDSAAQDLSLSVFGAGESSTLYKNLVLADGLANASSASTMFFAKGGTHFLRVVFPPKNLKKILTRLETVIKKTCREGLSKEDVLKVKGQYVASKIYDRESLSSYAFMLGSGMAQTGDPLSEEKFIDKVKVLGHGKISAAFRDIFMQESHVSLQVPLENKVGDAKQLLQGFSDKLASIKQKLNTQTIKDHKFKTSAFDSEVRLVEIKKGVKLLYRRNTLTPTFVFQCYLKGGLSSESKENNGVYNLISGMLTKGYDEISLDDLNHSLEGMSASLNGFSGKNAYGLTLHGQTDHVQKLMQHFFGSFLRPRFESSHFEHEVEMSLRSLLAQTEDPIKKCFASVGEVMFPDHPYAMNILGSVASLGEMKVSAASAIHTKNVIDNELLFTYCGDLEFDDIFNMVKSQLTAVAAKNNLAKTKNKYKEIKKKSNISIFHEIDREQTQIYIGFQTKSMNDKMHHCLKMLTTYFSGQSSKLFVDVRDKKGLCYSAAPIHFSALEGGHWGIYMASGHDKVEAAVEAIYALLEEVRCDGLSKSDFSRIKKMIDGQNLLNIQTNDDYADIYSVATLQGLGMDFFHLNNQIIRNMKYEDFQKNIKSFFKQKPNKVIVGRS